MYYYFIHTLRSTAIFFLLFFNSCTKKTECITIEEKREVNGNFYFYWVDDNWVANNGLNSGSTLDTSGVPDRYASGQVSAEDYAAFSIGDRYCNAD